MHARDVLRDFGSAHRGRVKAALRAEGLADAQLIPFAAVGPDLAALVRRAEAFARDQARPRGPTHLGVGIASAEGEHCVVAIFSRRTVALSPLPRRLPGRGITVRGRVRGRAEPSAYLLGPIRGERAGSVRALPLQVDKGRLRVPLPARLAPGRFVFQLVEGGPRGPEVAAQWTFVRGEVAGPWPPPARAASSEDSAGAARLLADLRDRADLAPLAPAPALDRAAAAYARAMCASKITAHRVPGGSTPESRARAAGYRGRVAENVARAASVGVAHQNLALSPSHRQNLLDPAAEHVGVGVATAPAEEGVAPSRCLVQLFGFGGAQR